MSHENALSVGDIAVKIKMPANELEFGMYVAELDRSWIGTPFLFQGFLIRDEEELLQLREVCDYVFIDDLQSSMTPGVQRKLQETLSRVRSTRSTRITVEFEEWSGLERLRNTLRSLENKREVAVKKLHRLVANSQDVSGETLRETRQSAAHLIEGISEDPKTGFWLTLLSENDEELGAHAVNTSVLCVGFAAYLGFDEALRQAIGQGAMLHDIGMSKVPAWLRSRRGRLKEQEYALIKHHAAYGARLLMDMDGIDRRIVDIVGMHHERIDGKGYPRGLHDEQIPLHVKLVSVCNKYDSLTRGSDRAAALPPAAAMQTLISEADAQFDRAMVEAFIRWIGVYPLGSLVLLRNGYLCLVISTDPVRRLKPTVLLVQDPKKRHVTPRKTVNLEVLSRSPMAPDWSIESIVSPAVAGVDVRQLLLEEFQLQRHVSSKGKFRIPA